MTQVILQEPYRVFDKREMKVTDFRKDQPMEELTHNHVTLYSDTNIMDKIF